MEYVIIFLIVVGVIVYLGVRSPDRTESLEKINSEVASLRKSGKQFNQDVKFSDGKIGIAIDSSNKKIGLRGQA